MCCVQARPGTLAAGGWSSGDPVLVPWASLMMKVWIWIPDQVEFGTFGLEQGVSLLGADGDLLNLDLTSWSFT